MKRKRRSRNEVALERDNKILAERLQYALKDNKDQAEEVTKLVRENSELSFKMTNFDAIVAANKEQGDKITELEKAKSDMALAMAIAHSQREMFRIKWQRIRKMHLGLRMVLSTLAANPDDFEEFDRQAEGNEGRT